LVGDRLFVFGRQGEEEVVWCLQAASGEQMWRHAYPAVAVTGAADKYQGPRSSPAVTQGKVVTLGVGGVLTCLKASTGSLLWHQAQFIKSVPLFFTAMSPLVTENRCVVHLGGQDDGVVAAFDLVSGKLIWEWRGEGPSYSSPALLSIAGATQVVVHTEKGLLGLSLANGRRLWSLPTPAKPGYWSSASPVIDAPCIYYTGQGIGTTAVQIEKQGEAFTAIERWRNDQFGTVYNTPVLKDGLLYAMSDRGHFFCLDAHTGKTAWSDTNRVSNFGTLLDAGSVLAAVPEKSGLIVFRPSRDRFQEVVRYKLSDLAIYAFPVFSGKRIYVRDAQKVSIYEIGAGERGKSI
jgi:outer membrane protein assembly factor BamB